MEETRNVSIWKMLCEYKEVFFLILRTPATRFIIIIYALINVFLMVTGNFVSLYLTEDLLVSQELIAIFPMIRAALMLGFIFTLQNRINHLPYRPVMAGALILYVISHVMLLQAPAGDLWLILGYTVFEAFACSLLMPRKDALMVLFIDEKERSRSQSLLYVVTMGITTPFGWLIGQLSAIDRHLLFVLNIAIFLLMLVIVMCSKELKKQDAS